MSLNKIAVGAIIVVTLAAGSVAYCVRKGILVLTMIGEAPRKAVDAKEDKIETQEEPRVIVEEAAVSGDFAPAPGAIFAEMPKDAFPKLGKDAAATREAARNWCLANLVGKKSPTLEWTALVKDDSEVSGKEIVTVALYFEGLPESCGSSGCGVSFGSPFMLGDQKSRIILRGELRSEASGIFVRYEGCTKNEARSLRKLEGKKVKLSATITDVQIGDDNTYGYVLDPARGVLTKHYDSLPIVFDVSLPTIDGVMYGGAHKSD